jgi:hypothetical protein
MPEADAEGRRRVAEAADDLDRDAGVGRPPGTGGDDEVRRREPLGIVQSISSLRTTFTSTPSAPNRCARLYVNES